MAAPCCGAQYAFPRYTSMNFSAFEYWTNGWNDGNLMPKDYGLRVCACGSFVLKKEMVDISSSCESDAPHMDFVAHDQIHECIARASCPEMEIAARRLAWHDLNHCYRDQYRTHREAEEASLRAAWQSANPDRRSFWQRLVGHKAPVYLRPDTPITCPEFKPSSEQIENMTKLCELIVEQDKGKGDIDMLELAELHRELGRFDEAGCALSKVPDERDPVAKNLIGSLIAKNEANPVRFRY